MKILLFLFLFITACGQLQGTDTGNPENNQQEETCGSGTPTSERCMPTPYIDGQVIAICDKIHTCFGTPFEVCRNATFTEPGLQEEMDIPLETYLELNQLYNSKKVSVHSARFNQCFNAIHDLSCDSEILKAAFPMASPQTFEFIHSILRADPICQTVYSLKEAL